MHQGGVFNGQSGRFFLATVNNRGDMALTTQAAARTFPHIFTDFRENNI
jgi:hypothetical protein